MSENHFEAIKGSVLTHVQTLFEEMEQTMAMQHQEKFALLEDAFTSATDVDELRVAFEQWYTEHSEDLDLEQEAYDIWATALANLEEEQGISLDRSAYEGNDDDEEEDVSEFSGPTTEETY